MDKVGNQNDVMLVVPAGLVPGLSVRQRGIGTVTAPVPGFGTHVACACSLTTAASLWQTHGTTCCACWCQRRR